MVSVSGVRGIYGNGLTGDIAERFCFAYGNIYAGTIVVGRDSRESGKELEEAGISGLLKAGCDVINIGIATTPTVEMAVPARNAAGGVIITASHNPAEWNGFKFLGPDGVFLNADKGAEVLSAYQSSGSLESTPRRGTVSTWSGADKHHIDAILSLDLIKPGMIAGKRFTVCLDPNHGAGGPICGKLLERLGCTVHIINGEPTGEFAHGAEPVPENLGDLVKLVRETGSATGFAVDPDTDRLSLVDERGTAPGEEYSLALAAEFFMSHGIRVLACNLSTSRMVDDIATRYGGTVHRSKVGEINVVEKMRETGAVAGGEGNGGIIYAPLHPGRDAVLGIALMLQFMAERNEPLSALIDSIPRYRMVKEKMQVSERVTWREPVIAAFPRAGTDTRDGIKIILRNSWVHVRESNTEPVIRVIAEAPDESKARELIRRVREAIG